MEKRFKNGLCLGKFMPIHNGHIYMIREAQKQCETVHVMVCSRPCEPIDGLLRYAWALEIFRDDDDIKIYHCGDENPQYPEDHPDFWEIWNKSVYSRIEELDSVFGSEDYIIPFAKSLNVEGVVVDIDRAIVPVSGTDIRAYPLQAWEYIPDVVKPYFKVKVAIVGPESSGKTTLTNKLAEHFEGDAVMEFGREYTETVPPRELTSEDYLAIMHRQWADIKKAKASNLPFLFTDTEAIVTKTFSEMYGVLDMQLATDMNVMIQRQVREFDFYILCYPDIEWEDDGTREFSEYESRMDHFLMIKDHLDAYNANYVILRGQDNKRFTNAIQLVGHMKSINHEKYWNKISFDR